MTYLATDLDGTFIPLPDNAASKRALDIISRSSDTSPLELVYVTGRHLASVFEAIDEHSLPVPTWILADVGTCVYRRDEKSPDSRRFEVVDDYKRRLDQIVGGSDPDEDRRLIATNIAGLSLQESFKQGPHKLSYFAEAHRLEELTQTLRTFIELWKMPYGVVASVDPFNGDGLVDVMPREVSKAFAISWWCEHRGVKPEEVVFAGDSGNDYDALVAGHKAILVSNADRSLVSRVQTEHERRGYRDRLFLATEPSTAGVLQGARWFGIIQDMQPTCVDPAGIDLIELNRTLGAVPVSANATQFCVWAPQQDRLEIKDAANDRIYPLRKFESGYHVGVIEGMCVNDRYFVQIPNGPARPDPASRFQPDGVHGPSQIVDRSFAWTDTDWKGVRRDDLIVYELHIGTFTDIGTFTSAIDRLRELVELGVTAIEIMPPNETAGRWNWGYDGVNLFAPRQSYGTPNDFRRFVDVAHSMGLAVIVDVVYNHFGPEGNYLGDFGSYISTKHNTVWGAAPNLDGARDEQEMRRFLIANAIHWLDEYHVDGLRVDAIHCIRDESERHWVAELSDAVRRWGESQNREPLLIAEANVYDPEMMIPLADGGYDFDASWCDCFLHSVFGVVRPGEQLSNRVYDQTDLTRVLDQGFIFDGTIRRERERRELTHRVPTHGLVYSIQNHDFIGNHPLGLRLHQLTSIATQRAAAALLVLTPAIPMLFMGEEFCCDQPFQFFVDFGDAGLRRGVVEGRRAEYPQHDWTDSVLPIDPEAFYQSRIGSIADGDPETWTWYQSLISLRKRLRKLGLLDDTQMTTQSDVETGLYLIEYSSGPSHVTVAVRIAANGAPGDEIELPKTRSQLVLDSLSQTFTAGASALVLKSNHAKVFLDTLG